VEPLQGETSVTESKMMQRFTCAALVSVVCLLVACSKNPPPSEGVEVKAPGVEVEVDKDAVNVKAPGTDVEVERK
jgi:hypothetical protein